MNKRVKPPGSGRKKGTANKWNQTAREALECAFQGIGGVHALTEWGRENPTEFYKLYARLIPVQMGVKGNITFEGLGPIYEDVQATEEGRALTH